MIDLSRQDQLKPISGTIEKLTLSSAIMGMERKVQIYLPPSYHAHSNKRYPVLYMHFGQRIFDPPRYGGDSWQVHRLIESLLAENRIEEIIVIGIAAKRATIVSDYSHYVLVAPVTDGKLSGFQFEAFILEELKPFVDRTYRTLSDCAHTAMIGASNGAVVTYNIAERHPTIFGKIALLSPNTHSLFTKRWLYQTPMGKYDGLMWVGCGDAESHYMPQVRELLKRFLELGFIFGEDFFYTLTQDGGHDDSSWGAQMIHPLLLFFGKNESKVIEGLSDHHRRIGTPITLELYGQNEVGNGNQPLIINPLIQYDSGFAMTELDGSYKVWPHSILRVQPDGCLFGLREGAATVEIERDGLTASRVYHVLPDLNDVIELHLRAYVPDDMPEIEQIYFGVLPLKRVNCRYYEGRHTLPRDYAQKDLFSWRMHKFELRLDGTPMPKRLLRVNRDCTVEYTIERWAT